MSQAFFRDALVQAVNAAGGTPNPGAVDAAADELTARHAEPIRAYHNALHIQALLEGFAETGQACSPALRFAVLYHDVIYDPQRNDNEAASADVAKVALNALGVDPAVIARTSDLIRATQHGVRKVDACDAECALLLDLDLAILGSAPEVYRVYAKAIRHEYAHVPDALYRTGRTRVLQMFLDLPQIFQTPEFQTRCEESARTNLAAEIARLADGN